MKIKIPKEETEGAFEGWVRVDAKNAVAVYRKMLAQQRKTNIEEYPDSIHRMRGSMLLYLSAEERSSEWITLPLGKVEKIMAKHQKEIKYRNCTMTPFFYIKTHRFSISVWPRHHQDDTRNKDNNWGEEE
jgi:hypothetical protein